MGWDKRLDNYASNVTFGSSGFHGTLAYRWKSGSDVASGLLGMVKTYGWVNPDYALYIMLDMFSSAAFIILPILIGFTAAREFGGNPYPGATLGGILTYPALTNAWGVASGFHTMSFFGLEVAMIGYQGTVFPVLLAVWFMSMLEKRLCKIIPDSLDLILTPFLTVIISGFIAMLIIGPAGRALGDGISFALSTLITHAGWLAGLLFSGLYSVIVITGVHHSFHAIEAGLLGNPSPGVNFLLPIWAMANVAQGGAWLAVWFKTKDMKIKAIALPSAFSALPGITEAAIFGINLRFVKTLPVSARHASGEYSRDDSAVPLLRPIRAPSRSGQPSAAGRSLYPPSSPLLPARWRCLSVTLSAALQRSGDYPRRRESA